MIVYDCYHLFIFFLFYKSIQSIEYCIQLYHSTDMFVMHICVPFSLTLLHLEKPKLYTVLAILSAIGFREKNWNF